METGLPVAVTISAELLAFARACVGQDDISECVTVAQSGAAVSTQDPRLAWLNVQPSGTGQVMLINGLLLGATPESSWAIYSRGGG